MSAYKLTHFPFSFIIDLKLIRVSSRLDNRAKDIYVATFRRELENDIGCIGSNELGVAVKQLYLKYVRGEGTDKEIKPNASEG